MVYVGAYFFINYNNTKIIKGIYKIDFPSKKSYIGQSIDLDRRMNEYKN